MFVTLFFQKLNAAFIPFLAGLLLMGACQQSADLPYDISVAEFLVAQGFKIDLLAAEPLLDSPVDMTMDTEGRFWVVELPGYMRDIDGSDEKEPDGKIVVLTDQDKDGRMDHRTVVLDSLVAPRTLLLAYGGLLYSDGTDLWWTALNNLKTGRKVLVDSLYVVGGNIEHQPNGLLYHLDNWIYSANSKARYRLQGGNWKREVTRSRGQWGLSADAEGHLFYNNNSVPVMTDYLMPGQCIANPSWRYQFTANQAIATHRRLNAYQATAVNRGYQDGVLDEEGKVREFTSACSPLVYQGNQFPKDYQGDVFVCAPEANLVKHYDIRTKNGNKTAHPASDTAEFLVSKNETFRPVSLYNGADGTLYVLDLRKGIIQHRAYMTSYLRQKILDKQLDTIRGRGRIYRVTNIDQPIAPGTDYSQFTPKDWLPLLASENGYLRMQAQQYLVANADSTIQPELERVAANTQQPFGQIHALWTLQGLNLLKNDFLQKIANTANHPVVIAQIIRLTEFFPDSTNDFLSFFQKAVNHSDYPVHLQLAVRASTTNTPAMRFIWSKLAKKYVNDPIVCEALLSGLTRQTVDELLINYSSATKDTLVSFLKKLQSNLQDGKHFSPKLPTATFQDNRTAGMDLFQIHCASCHGLDGAGKDNLAPPLAQSEYVSGSKKRLTLLVLQGLKGPVHVGGKRFELNLVMPGIKNHPDLTDQDIANLLIFVRNSFHNGGFSDNHVPTSLIAECREMVADRNELFTEKELMDIAQSTSEE